MDSNLTRVEFIKGSETLTFTKKAGKFVVGKTVTSDHRRVLRMFSEAWNKFATFRIRCNNGLGNIRLVRFAPK